MKLLIFSDVHGNIYALEALYKQLPKLKYDKIVFLGDIFGYYYYQEQCIELLKEFPKLTWLKGNHDEYAVESYFRANNEEKLISLYGHSYENLVQRFPKSDMELIARLEASDIMLIDGKKIGFFHGRPMDTLEGRIYGNTIITADEINGFDAVISGHTHCKIDRVVGKTKILSPGSLGQPRDGRGYGYMLYDTETDMYEFINVEVDNGLLRNDIDKRDSNLEKLYDVLQRENQ